MQITLDELYEASDKHMTTSQYRSYKKKLYNLSVERDFLEDKINLYKEQSELTCDEKSKYDKAVIDLDRVNNTIHDMIHNM